MLGVSFPAFAGDTGEVQFQTYCSACHKVTGLGVPHAFPALAGDKFVRSDGAAVARVVLNGRGGMPAFRGSLSDDQIAAIISYVRSAWGNKAPPVAAATVAAARSGIATVPQGLQAH
jgi:mono/diheme cytochrome c family protein